MCHLYLLIATTERSAHDSFMPDKYFSSQSSHSLFIGIKVPEMKVPPPLPQTIYEWEGRDGWGYRYCLNLSNSNIHKSLIRSQCCNQPSQQQQGSCRINPSPRLGSVWLHMCSGGLPWDRQSRDNMGSWGLLWHHRDVVAQLSEGSAGSENLSTVCEFMNDKREGQMVCN